ncbi:MAG TPA: hypothetical protein VGM87_23230 [Roseomonas sp.]
MRKPNYDFERSQRARAKDEKAKEKAQRKQEKKAGDADGQPQTSEETTGDDPAGPAAPRGDAG